MLCKQFYVNRTIYYVNNFMYTTPCSKTPPCKPQGGVYALEIKVSFFVFASYSHLQRHQLNRTKQKE